MSIITVEDMFECPFKGSEPSGCDTCGPDDICLVNPGNDCYQENCKLIREGVITVQWKGKVDDKGKT